MPFGIDDILLLSMAIGGGTGNILSGLGENSTNEKQRALINQFTQSGISNAYKSYTSGASQLEGNRDFSLMQILNNAAKSGMQSATNFRGSNYVPTNLLSTQSQALKNEGIQGVNNSYSQGIRSLSSSLQDTISQITRQGMTSSLQYPSVSGWQLGSDFLTGAMGGVSGAAKISEATNVPKTNNFDPSMLPTLLKMLQWGQGLSTSFLGGR